MRRGQARAIEIGARVTKSQLPFVLGDNCVDTVAVWAPAQWHQWVRGRRAGLAPATRSRRLAIAIEAVGPGRPRRLQTVDDRFFLPEPAGQRETERCTGCALLGLDDHGAQRRA